MGTTTNEKSAKGVEQYMRTHTYIYIYVYTAASILLQQQQQLFINQLGITIIFQWLFPTGFGHHNRMKSLYIPDSELM